MVHVENERPNPQHPAEEIPAYVALDKPDAAEKLATRIVAVVENLRNHPHMGHTGAEPEIRRAEPQPAGIRKLPFLASTPSKLQ